MAFQEVVNKAKTYFPNLKIEYKNESTFMMILSKLLFFNKSFAKLYITTIGNTVYYPSKSFISLLPLSSIMFLLHELVHVHDSKKVTAPVFGFLYLFPQILSLLLIPLFLISWKIALPLVILFALPIPAYFRANYEKRAYIVTLYAINRLSQIKNFDPRLELHAADFIKQFKGSYYYFMWNFNSIDTDFSEAISKIKANERPFEDSIFNIVDDLLTVV